MLGTEPTSASPSSAVVILGLVLAIHVGLADEVPYAEITYHLITQFSNLEMERWGVLRKGKRNTSS
jgi:hypothetical protein